MLSFVWQKAHRMRHHNQHHAHADLFPASPFCVTPGSTRPPSSSWTRWTRSGRRAQTTRGVAVTVRCSAPCWSCSTSWTASRRPTRSRWGFLRFWVNQGHNQQHVHTVGWALLGGVECLAVSGLGSGVRQRAYPRLDGCAMQAWIAVGSQCAR